MNALTALHTIVRPSLSLLDDRYTSREAECLLLAIAMQESGFRARRQKPVAHARGFWQFERIGVRQVLTHRSTADEAKRLARLLVYEPDEPGIYEAIADNDLLACGIARLFLWPDPHALPELGDEDGAWETYLRVWRPGKPHEARWPRNYEIALEAVT